MKKIIKAILIIIFCVSLFFLIFTGFNSKTGKSTVEKASLIITSEDTQKNFVNCIFNDAYEAWNHNAWLLRYLDRYKDSLHFNTLQYYNYPEVSNYYGTFNLPMTQQQIGHNIDLLDSVQSKNLVTFTARQNIEKYCYGQRLVYEVSENGSTTINDGFCYREVMADTYTTDSGRTVLHAKPWPMDNYNGAGYLCKNIYENLQHTDIYDFVQLDAYAWYLKPVMRIPQNIYNDSNTTPVASVSVINYIGEVIDSVVIRVNNFRNDSNNYNGNYQSKFNFDQHLDSLKTSGSPVTGLGYGRDRDFRLWADNCKVDFRIYWFGEVEVWFDNLTVDDDRAKNLFNPVDTSLHVDELIKQESLELGSHSANKAFYADEVIYSNFPCINYVDSVLKSVNPDSKLHTAITNYFQIRGFKNNEVAQKVYFQNTHLNSFNSDAHVFEINTKIPYNFSYYDSRIPKSSISTGYNDYNVHLQNSAFGDRNSILPENTSQDDNDPPYWESLVYQITLSRKYRDLYSPDAQFIMQPQIHSNAFMNNTDEFFLYGNCEPTNEEIQAQAMISIAHGAEGICWFLYPSVKSEYNSGTLRNYPYGDFEFESQETYWVYNYGLTELLQTDSTLSPRYSNMYGQDKWNCIKNMNIKIEHWSVSLDKIIWDSGYSVHSEGANHNFISEIKSFYSTAIPPFSGSQVYEDSVKYWEEGFFKPDFSNSEISQFDKSRYFIMVNRRCFPNVNNDGDLRQLKIKFDSLDLAGFRNWAIIDLNSNKLIRTFDKDSNVFVDMGIYHPGEGKLYKLAPVMQEGGELIADENVTASEFNCISDVYSENKGITINPGITVNFADTVKWEFTGGEINIGSSEDDTPVFLKNMQGQSWKGISIIKSSSVNIFRTTFSGLKNNSTALSFLDNYEYNISNNTFNLTDLDSVSAIEIDYVMPSDTLQSAGCGENCEEDFIYVNGFINENTKNTTSSILPSVKCFAYGQYIVALMMNRNTLNSESGTIAVLLSNTTSGNIKNNKIYNYNTGICIYSPASYCDLYHNEISGDSTAVKIFNSTINLGMQDYAYTGGFNLISSLKNNINTNEGYFSLSDGLNTFNIDHQTSPHLEGTFDSENSLDEYAGDNCFKTFSSSGYSPRENVTCTGLNCDVTFLFNQICAIEQTEDYLVIDVLGDGSILDTIWIEGGGSGVGIKSNFKLKITNYELNEVERKTPKPEFSEKMVNNPQNPETGTMRELYNTICIEMRKRNFNAVHDKCIELLNNYADSSEASDAASKLYLSDLVLDSSGNRLSSLKSYFETLILNNGSNERLIRQLFYLVQKCKTALGEYQSAMSGFQQIIEQNPYNYLGLVASWDFSATFLLNSIHGGSGGGFKNYLSRQQADELKITNEEIDEDDKQIPFDDSKSKNVNPKSKILTDDPNEKYDKSKFTKEERILIKENVIKSYENSREKETKRLKYLEDKISEGKANESDKKELSEKRMISEVVKVKEPVDVKQHLEFVSRDLKKLFGAGGYNSSDNNEITIIPDEYRLYQNYPNPFNPVTRIKFSLPEESSVKLTVYDILGREVKKLVNEKLSIGRYEYEFDGSNFSSGVYFYILRAGEFVQTKRMVLIK